MRSSRHPLLFVSAAVFLLLFTAVDLAYPKICAEDGENDSAAVSRYAGATTQSITTAAGSSDPTDQVPLHADDCFCCCGHVVAGVVFYMFIPRGTAEMRPVLSAHRAGIQPPTAYRPPRSA